MTSTEYPPAPPQCFSIARLYSAFARGDLPLSFWLGGRISQIGPNRHRLSGQGLAVDIEGTELLKHNFEVGDGACFQVKAMALKAFGETIVISECYDSFVAFRTRVEPEPWGVADSHHASWMGFISEVAKQLRTQGLTQVQTPTLVVNPGMEAHLQPFATTWNWGRSHEQLFLPTSPEIHLKRLLARGWTDIFEVARVFRNEELSPHHQPEFTMLEWYRAFADLSMIEADLQTLILALEVKAGQEPAPWSRISVPELFERHLGIKPDELMDREVLTKTAKAQGLRGAGGSWADDFHGLWVQEIEPKLKEIEGWLLVTDYPAPLAALARIGPEGWAQRFELYRDGLEIANAFHELNDPDEQRRRWSEEIKLRRALFATELPVDENFLRGLESGMPPSGGIAVGLERLFMAMFGVREINEVYLFPR